MHRQTAWEPACVPGTAYKPDSHIESSGVQDRTREGGNEIPSMYYQRDERWKEEIRAPETVKASISVSDRSHVRVTVLMSFHCNAVKRRL